MQRITLSIVFFLALTRICSQNFDSACVQQRHVARLLDVLHFSPPELNAQTGREIIDLFIRNADEKNVLFSRQNAGALRLLADRVQPPDLYCAAIQLSYIFFTDNLRLLDSLTQLVAHDRVIPDGTDTINFVYRKSERIFYENAADLHSRIGKRVKYDMLRSLGRSLSRSQAIDPSGQLLVTARERSISKFRRHYEKLNDPGALLSHLSDCMSDAIARRYDPHSNYLNASGFGNYRNALSARERSFGFSVTENKTGDLEISELVPGGPAWNSAHLEEKDILLAIRPHGGELIPASELGADEINAMLDEASLDVIGLVVTRDNREPRSVELTRDVIHSAQNLITGYVVRLNGRRIGHISIPAFYLDDQPEGHNGCANDVAREIYRLQEDSIEGLIIDLRFNGGGSMREAISLTGLFIDEGPVAIYHTRNETPFFLKDMNRGKIWDGPLLVMINGASASASEFVAAALQDYHRAVIAGSRSYGKGTAQNLLPADTNEMTSVYASGTKSAIKITGGKFYRLTGKSLQASGIEPDITIPGILDHVIEREADLPFALRCDSVTGRATTAGVRPACWEEAFRRSRQRLSEARFAAIKKLADSLQRVSHNTERVALQLDAYLAHRERHKVLNERIERLFTAEDPAISISPTRAATAVNAIDSFLRRRNERLVSSLSKDVVFHESVRIMADMIVLQSP